MIVSGLLLVPVFVAVSVVSAVAAQQLTLTISPMSVPNGGAVTLTGTAPCRSVVIEAHPGALGVRTGAPITAPVTDGRFSAQFRLPTFDPDPSRPGVDEVQTFVADCVGTFRPSVTAMLHVRGIGLPKTGVDTFPMVGAGLASALIGLALLALIRRRSATARR